MNSIRTFIQSYAPFSDSDWEAFSAQLSYREYRSGSFLLEEGKLCRHLFFLEKGVVRFTYDKGGDIYSKYFTAAPYCLTSQASFLMDTPSSEGIQALENCKVYLLEKASAYQLLKLEAWNSFVRQLVQEVQINTDSIYQESQTLSAEERYKKLVQENYSLLQRIPQKHVATFLGIAPQSLSRIRKRIAEKRS